MLTPGTLLIAKNVLLNKPYDYFRTYRLDPGVASPHLFKNIEENDTILIIDYLDDAWHSKGSKMYRIWVNGQEAYMNSDILERQDYYEVVK